MSENQDFSTEELGLLRGLPRRHVGATVVDLIGPVADEYEQVGTWLRPVVGIRRFSLARFRPLQALDRTRPLQRRGPGVLPGRSGVLGWGKGDVPHHSQAVRWQRGLFLDRLEPGEPVMARPVRVVSDADRAELENYVPRINGGHWLTIRDFVLATMTDYLPHTQARIGPMLRHLVTYVDWMHHVADVPLERNQMLDPDMIAFYVANVTDISKSSRTTRRACLLRMCDFLLPDMRRTVRMQPIGKEPAARPYSSEEIARLRKIATEQDTPYLRHSAWTLVVLGLGAGLASGDLLEVRREDIFEDERGVFVRVRHSNRCVPRVVPILDEFADEAMVLASCVQPGAWVFRSNRNTCGHGNVAAWARRLRGEGELRINLTRMRSTWIVRHLNAGVPLAALMRASGVTTCTGFDRYIPYLDEPTADEILSLMQADEAIRARRSRSMRRAQPLLGDMLREHAREKYRQQFRESLG